MLRYGRHELMEVHAEDAYCQLHVREPSDLHAEGLPGEVADAVFCGGIKEWGLILIRGVLMVGELHEDEPFLRYLLQRLADLDQHPDQPAHLVLDTAHVGTCYNLQKEEAGGCRLSLRVLPSCWRSA